MSGGREPAYSILPTFDHTPWGIRHFPNCDIFSSGLTHEQIEEFVRMREGDTCLLYAVGLNIDPDFIAYLTEKYPDTFRLHLSVVTFDPEIRRRLMHPAIDVDVLRRVCGLTRQATFFLLLSVLAYLRMAAQPERKGRWPDLPKFRWQKGSN